MRNTQTPAQAPVETTHLEMSCSPSIALITSPAARNSRALKKA